MIFGVPSGGQQIHVDIDLSDIGILSQKPIDFIYKGYNSTQFENAQQFKESTNLDGLTQILSQNQSVHVYPFWGDSNLEEIAISRCDIQVQYKFEPTCVFFGAIMTDNYNNNIGHKCSSSKYAGFNRHLVTGEGTIEMIRKTPDNLVEEFQIQGNRLIDGDGVWCYQIPMNLDFVGTDEFGNIIPTDDPKKGIPTKTSVRFRVSMQETGNEGVSRHRAKYLIPNVQELVDDSIKPQIPSGKKFEQCYEFGSATPNEYYRDLYWNKVYSVKNYIPRIQTNGKKNTQNYSAIRTVNSNNDVNPVPFNHARFRLAFGYRVLCMIMTIVFTIICGINALLSGIAGFKLPLIGRVFKWLCSLTKCIGVSGGLTEDEDANIEYFPCCSYSKCIKCGVKGCTPETDLGDLLNVVQQSLSQEYDTVNLDFHNDWLNGSLYLPLWFWKKTKKKKYLFGLFSKKAVNSYCACSKNFPKLRVTQGCSLTYGENDYLYKGNDKDEKFHDVYPNEKTFTIFGVIKEFVNKAGLNIYYYAPGIPNVPNYKELDEPTSYVRLYSTDIILLGSLNSCDLDNYPNVFTNLPTTTVNVPFIATIKQAMEEEEGATYMEGTAQEQGFIEVTGMDWLNDGEDGKPKYGAGLFIDLACNAVYTKPKTCANLERLCELGVTIDTYMEVPIAKNGNLTYNTILADGMITRYEIVDNETRAMFASLNNNGLTEKIFNPNTGYDTYKLRYVYPIDFDGHMAKYSEAYTSMMEFKTYDFQDPNYVEFKFGPKYKNGNLIKHYYSKESGGWSFPIFNNSFYFYFGIHEGSTAIDKFNSRFYATCYRDEKYPFTMIITTEPAKWCSTEDTDYGSINIELNGIKTPYSYKLTNEFNEEILEENGLYNNELHFGYKIKTDGGEYQLDNNGKLIKSGIFTEFLTGKDTDYKVENGTYKLTITDTNGNVGTQNIILDQVPISLVYEALEMGEKYYDDTISKESDFCNANEFFGEIRISAVTIDGRDYRITNAVGGNGEYNLSLTNKVFDENCREVSSSTEMALLQIAPQANEKDDDTFRECTCHGVGGYPEARLLGGFSGVCSGDTYSVLSFPIWKPKTYKITITQYCNGELNDNTSEIMANVKNGAPFNAYINEAPLKFILGKNEQYNSYNRNFYKINATMPTELPGWFGLHKENTYVFSGTTLQYKDIWSDFVTVSTAMNTNGDENDRTQYVSEDSLFNIVEYKFKTMFNLSKSAYVVGDSDSKLAITHSGGKAPILYRGNYPEYSEIIGDETPTSGGGETFQLYVANSDGSITCNNAYPNIVGNNYTYISPKSGTSVVMSNDSNPYFNRTYSDFKNIGNYFAVFSRNGGITDDGEGNCTYNKNLKIQEIPYKASPVIKGDGYDELICLDGESESNKLASICYKGSGDYKPYFRGEFVDRRLDYDFVILTPYAGDDVTIISSEDKNETIEAIWKKGRFSGITMNGVEMVYNNTTEYEVVGPTLEYYYNIYTNDNTRNSVTVYNPKIGINGYENGINIVDKRYYKTILKCGNKKYDINNMYWAYDANGNVTYTIGANPKLRNPKYYGYTLIPLGGAITVPEMFAYDHSADFNGGKYNGDFSISNYPTKRLLDIGNIPSCDKLTFNCSSCSYNVDLSIANGEEELTITGATEETDELEFMIDCRNMINPELPSLEECASQGSSDLYNVKFNADGDTFTANTFQLKCKVKQDTYNSTHEVYTEFPVLCKIKDKGKDENKISDIKNNSKTIDELQTNINNIRIKRFGYDSSSVKDIKRATKAVKRGPFTFNINGYYWVTSSDTNMIAYDDNTNVKNVIYNTGRMGIDSDVVGVYLKRNYLNNSGDNLNKNISTIQFTSIYDVRKFEMEMCCDEIIANRVDISGSADVTVEDVITGISASSSSGSVTSVTGSEGNANGDGEINNDNTTAQTKYQHVILRINTKVDDINWNQQFFEVDSDGNYIVESLTAVLGVKLSSKNRKITNDIKISCENNGGNLSILFDIMFTGELGEYTLDGVGAKEDKVRDKTCALYIAMPNKLVYMIEFKFKDLTSTSDCCVEGTTT